MPDKQHTSVSRPFAVLSSEGLIPKPQAGSWGIHEQTNTQFGATIASGFVSYNDMATGNFTLWYDEILMLHSCDGMFELECEGQSHPMKVGDVAWIRAGTTVVYRAIGGSATLFYAVVPGDWDSRRTTK